MLPIKPTAVLSLLLLLSFCTGVDLIDDYVPPVIRITSSTTSIPVGKAITFEASYFNNVGMQIDEASIVWSSANPEILTVDAQGQGNPLKEGQVTIIAQIKTEEGTTLTDTITLVVTPNVILEEKEEDPPAEEPQEQTMNVSNTVETTITISPTLEITNRIAEITAETSFQFEVVFTDEKGNQESPPLTWMSSDETVIKIDANGLITAVGAGTATITVSVVHSNTTLMAQNTIQVNALENEEATTYKGSLETKSGYTLKGSFTFSETEDGIVLALGDDYEASSTLPGLYVYLSNNNNTTSQAYEIGAVKVFTGAHSYLLPANIGIKDYKYILYWCKPFNVKVGEAKIYD